MKMKLGLKSTALALSLASLVVGCGKAKQDSAATGVNASFKLTGSNSSATVAKQEYRGILGLLIPQALALNPTTILDSTGLTVNLLNAWVVVKEVEFKTDEVAGASEVDGDEVEFHGPYVVDLLTNSPLVLDTTSIASKPIRRIKMQLHNVDTLPSGAPAALNGHSFYIEGTVNGNSFSYLATDSTEISIAGPSSFTPGEGSQVMVEVQIANIFKQINLSGITNGEVISASSRHAGANLCPSIDASASDIYTCVRKALEKHANAGDDQDHDGQLESAEGKVK